MATTRALRRAYDKAADRYHALREQYTRLVELFNSHGPKPTDYTDPSAYEQDYQQWTSVIRTVERQVEEAKREAVRYLSALYLREGAQ